jgi:hypothetical protein
LWSILKTGELANLTSPTLAEVIQQARRGIERVRQTPHLAYWFLRHTGSVRPAAGGPTPPYRLPIAPRRQGGRRPRRDRPHLSVGAVPASTYTDDGGLLHHQRR